MTMIDEAVFELCGRPHLGCYRDLRCAAEAAYERFPESPLMREIEAEVGVRLNKRPRAVSRALARAAADIWDHGNRALLEEKYGFRERPSPKELLTELVRSVSRPVEYLLWQEPSTGRYGIIGKSPSSSGWLAVCPFFTDIAKIEAFIAFLNHLQAPLSDFQDLFFDSELMRIH